MSSQASAIRWEDADGIVTLTLDDPNQSANTMNDAYQAAMAQTITRLQAERAALKGVIITSAKNTFFAGGDLRLLVQATPERAAEMFAAVRTMTGQLRALETLGVPVVAALNGAALGGGLEIALACHRRIAMQNKQAEFGFPEVTLGLLPGGNGVVRSVRLLGIQKALLEVLLQGQRLSAERAQQVGLIDEIAPDREQMLARARAFILENPGAKQPWDKPGYAIPGGTPATPELALMLPAFPANLRKQLKGANMPAPKLILAAAVEGAQTDFDNAAKIEARYFVELATGRESKNLIQAFFFDMQRINAGASRPAGVPAYKPQKVGVLGAGMMGSGIAYSVARAGMRCVLKDVTREQADRGKAYSQGLVDKAVKRGSLSAEQGAALLDRITATADPADLAGCDLVIEAVFENRELKAKVTREAEAAAGKGVLMCSNTSTLPITGLAQASSDASRFLGLHFFSPVDKMPLVEIIAGKQTSDTALAQAFDFVRLLKKTPIVVNDSRGFFTSRVFGTFVQEGLALLSEGWNPVSIEQAAQQNGSPVGPLAVSDEVSLSLAHAVREQTKRDLAAEGQPIPESPGETVIERMLALGRPGKAKGAGFYEYPESGKKHLWQGLYEHFVKPERARPSAAEFAQMQDRLLYITSLESVRCLEEGVLRSVADANIGSIMGIGAPPWTGGTLQYINYVGTRAFAARATELARAHGQRFAPPKLLLKLAETDARFE